MNIEGTTAFFTGLGLAAFFVYLVAIVEILGGFEFELVLLLAALGIAFSGPGKYAVQWGSKAPAVSQDMPMGQ